MQAREPEVLYFDGGLVAVDRTLRVRTERQLRLANSEVTTWQRHVRARFGRLLVEGLAFTRPARDISSTSQTRRS